MSSPASSPLRIIRSSSTTRRIPRSLMAIRGNCYGNPTIRPCKSFCGAGSTHDRRTRAMSRKANPAVVGGFVLGAIALTVAAVAAFGGGKFFTHRERAVAFFEGDIQGLAVGSAVNLRGVQVGAVTDIALRLDVKTMHPVIAVYMEFDRNRIHFDRAVSATEMAEHEPLRTAIANGLHASLATQSLVTGQLVVELDLEPDKPTRLLGADPSTVEIPTSPSDFDKLKNTITQLP